LQLLERNVDEGRLLLTSSRPIGMEELHLLSVCGLDGGVVRESRETSHAESAVVGFDVVDLRRGRKRKMENQVSEMVWSRGDESGSGSETHDLGRREGSKLGRGLPRTLKIEEKMNGGKFGLKESERTATG
jgi:hypothetical protein